MFPSVTGTVAISFFIIRYFNCEIYVLSTLLYNNINFIFNYCTRKQFRAQTSSYCFWVFCVSLYYGEVECTTCVCIDKPTVFCVLWGLAKSTSQILTHYSWRKRNSVQDKIQSSRNDACPAVCFMWLNWACKDSWIKWTGIDLNKANLHTW